MSKEKNPGAREAGADNFAARWSRLKQQSKEAPPAAPAAHDPDAPPPVLPPIEALTIESDFSAFFHPKVDESLRRAALKKLFSDPRFNVMDGLDVYIDDYSKADPLPATMLAGLRQAQKIMQWAQETRDEIARKAAAADGSLKPQQPAEPLAAPEDEGQTAEPTPAPETRRG